MKVIITESQNNRIWLLRRYDLIKEVFDECFNEIKPCRFKTFDDYESYFYNVFMEILHPDYYLFDNFDYNGIMSEVKDMFYVELNEHYFERNC